MALRFSNIMKTSSIGMTVNKCLRTVKVMLIKISAIMT